MEKVVLHSHIRNKHPDVTDEDVLAAWSNIIHSKTRLEKDPHECIAVGVDGRGRLIELVAVPLSGGAVVRRRRLDVSCNNAAYKKDVERARTTWRKEELMDYSAENGQILTDEKLDKVAEKYEQGTRGGKMGKLVVGRPSLADEDVKSVSFRLPVSKTASMDARAGAKGKTRSEFMREVIEAELEKAV